VTEENPTWDRALDERTERAKREDAAANARGAGPAATVSPQWPAGGVRTPAGAEGEGVTAAERAGLWQPTREEEAEAKRLVLEAMSRDKGGGLLVAAAVMLLAAGASLIWVGTREPGAPEASPVRPVGLESAEVVSLRPPEIETALAPGEKPPLGRKLDIDDMDFGPEPVPDDFFEGPEPEI